MNKEIKVPSIIFVVLLVCLMALVRIFIKVNLDLASCNNEYYEKLREVSLKYSVQSSSLKEDDKTQTDIKTDIESDIETNVNTEFNKDVNTNVATNIES